MTNLTEDDIKKIIDEKIPFSLQDLQKLGRTNYTLSEKISTLIKNTQNKINTDINKVADIEPNISKTLFFKDILKSRIKNYSEIRNYYVVVKINNKKYIATQRVNNVIEIRSRLSFEDISNNTYIDNGLNLISTDFNATSGLLSRLPKTMFCFYKYWLNQLTGERAIGLTGNTKTSTATSGTFPNTTSLKNSIITIKDNADNDADKRYENLLNPNNINYLNKLLDYDPVEIIDDTLVDAFIAQNGKLNQLDNTYYSNMEANLLNKIDDTIDMVIGVPTISTWANNNNANNVLSDAYTDNLAFYNPLLEKSLNENFGYRASGDGGGYCLKLVKSNDLGENGILNSSSVISTEIKESPFVFSSFEGFLLCYGIKNILATLNTTGLDINIGHGMPPIISSCRYKGKTLEDGLITSGSNLPDPNLSNLNDLFINATENTLYRLDVSNNVKEWIRVGGSNTFNENVGIGNEDPSFNLDVSGDINFTGTLFQNGSEFVSSNWELSGNNIHRMNTLVGINKSNPIYDLDVSGDINFTGTLFQNGLGFVGSNWELSGNDIFRLNTKVGINKSNPSQALDIIGNITLTGDITSTSDIRFKENVIQLDNCLEKVSNLRGVYYNFKNENTRKVGMIAQEVEKVIPELVVDNDDRKTLNYQNMVAILIEAIKELKNKNEYLEKEIININKKLSNII